MEETIKFVIDRVKIFDELISLRDISSANNVPIISDEVASIIRTIIKIKRPARLLEIGSATGYSSIFFAMSYEDMKITTIERDPDRAKEARENINRYNMEERIELLEGDALEFISKLTDKYDILFLDGAKSKYKDFLQESLPFLNNNAIIIADNILFRGMVSGELETPKKHRTIVNKLREFLDEITSNDIYTSSILPIGDGLSISVYKGELE